MKHILPILTLTTLSAAASAQSAAASGLSYNRAGLSYNTDAAAGDNGYSLSVEALVGSSNDTYGAILRRSLNEIVAGLEGRFVYAHNTGAERSDSFVYELAYNVNSKYQVAVSIADQNDVDEEVSVTVRYNF